MSAAQHNHTIGYNRRRALKAGRVSAFVSNEQLSRDVEKGVKFFLNAKPSRRACAFWKWQRL